jgi:hypothetical protein
MNEYLPLAEKLLADLWATPVQCEVTDTLRGEGRNRVYRLRITGGPLTLNSVILKASVGDGNTPYKVGDDTRETPFWRFCNEWAGSEILGPLGIGPKAIAGDATRGFFLMEDLGAGESLADRLQGTDAQAASDALVAYARSLGQMARATSGKLEEWKALRRAKGGKASPLIPEHEAWERSITAFLEICQKLNIPLATTIADETKRIGEILENPGDYLAFTPSDCCPDNHFLRGDTVVFFDNEFAGMRHALLDLAYITAPFPTCWCANRLPNGMQEKLIAVYREEYPGDERFSEHLLYATTFWTFFTLSGGIDQWLETDSEWGISTIHQRHLLRLENFLNFPSASTTLPGLAQMAQTLYETLQKRWPDVEPMPLYAAFR